MNPYVTRPLVRGQVGRRACVRGPGISMIIPFRHRPVPETGNRYPPGQGEGEGVVLERLSRYIHAAL
jgi:hypothetical protein